MLPDPYQGELFIYICTAEGNRQSSKWAAHKELHRWFGGGCGKPSPCSCCYFLDRTSGISVFFISRDSLSFCQKHKNNNHGFWFAFLSVWFFNNERQQGTFPLFQWQSPDWEQDWFLSPLKLLKGQQPWGWSSSQTTSDFHCPGQNILASPQI